MNRTLSKIVLVCVGITIGACVEQQVLSPPMDKKVSLDGGGSGGGDGYPVVPVIYLWWVSPDTSGCYARPDKFVLQAEMDGIPVLSDTTASRFYMYRAAPGTYRFRVLSLFVMDDSTIQGGIMPGPGCSETEDLSWTPWSDPVVISEPDGNQVGVF